MSEYRNDGLVEEILSTCGATVPIFGFIDPWAVHQRFAQPILSTITSAGFRLVGLKYVRLGRPEAEQIYRKNKPHGETLAWHVPDIVYVTGMSLGFLVLPSDAHASFATLKQLKGFSDPARNGPGTIRFDFRAPNKSLALLHTSDDPPSSISEALTFFSPAELLACTRGHATEISWSQASNYCEKCGPNEFFGPLYATQLLAKMRFRLLESVQLGWQTADLERIWSEYLDLDLTTVSVVAERNLYLHAVERELAVLNKISKPTPSRGRAAKRWYVYEAREPTETVRMLFLLCDVARYSLYDTNDDRIASQLCYDRWEELLFKTTLFHW